MKKIIDNSDLKSEIIKILNVNLKIDIKSLNK